MLSAIEVRLLALAMVYYMCWCAVKKLLTDCAGDCELHMYHLCIVQSNKCIRQYVAISSLIITYIDPSVLINTPKLVAGVESLKVVVRTDKSNHHFQWYKSCIQFWCFETPVSNNYKRSFKRPLLEFQISNNGGWKLRCQGLQSVTVVSWNSVSGLLMVFRITTSGVRLAFQLSTLGSLKLRNWCFKHPR